jgi:hypothetical protein
VEEKQNKRRIKPYKTNKVLHKNDINFFSLCITLGRNQILLRTSANIQLNGTAGQYIIMVICVVQHVLVN